MIKILSYMSINRKKQVLPAVKTDAVHKTYISRPDTPIVTITPTIVPLIDNYIIGKNRVLDKDKIKIHNKKIYTLLYELILSKIKHIYTYDFDLDNIDDAYLQEYDDNRLIPEEDIYPSNYNNISHRRFGNDRIFYAIHHRCHNRIIQLINQYQDNPYGFTYTQFEEYMILKTGDRRLKYNIIENNIYINNIKHDIIKKFGIQYLNLYSTNCNNDTLIIYICKQFNTYKISLDDEIFYDILKTFSFDNINKLLNISVKHTIHNQVFNINALTIAIKYIKYNYVFAFLQYGANPQNINYRYLSNYNINKAFLSLIKSHKISQMYTRNNKHTIGHKLSYLITDDYVCPISFDIITEPVIIEDGQIYEYKMIYRYLKSNDKSPITGITLHSTFMYCLTSNRFKYIE
jgi:hypothetical protein